MRLRNFGVTGGALRLANGKIGGFAWGGAPRLDNSKGMALLAEVLRDLQTASGTSATRVTSGTL